MIIITTMLCSLSLFALSLSVSLSHTLSLCLSLSLSLTLCLSLTLLLSLSHSLSPSLPLSISPSRFLLASDLAVWGFPGDRHMFPRRSRVPQGHALQLPRGNGSGDQQEQPTAGRGVDGRLQRLLLHHIAR